MQHIDIQNQVRLGFVRTVGMTVNGMRHRLARSVVTILVIVVAIAFLMNTLSESLLKRSVGRQLEQRIERLRLTVNWAAHLSQAETIEQLLRRLGGAAPDDATWRQMRTFGQFDDAAMTALHGQATTAATYLNWLDGLNYGQYRRLVHNVQGAGAFERLRDPMRMQRFESELRAMPSLRLPTSIEQLHEFVNGWPALRDRMQQIGDVWEQAAKEIAVALHGRSMLEALGDADGEFGETIRRAGFELDHSTAGEMAGQAQLMLQMQRIERTIDSEPMRQAIAQRLDVLPGEVGTRLLWDVLASQSNAAWYLGRMEDEGLDAGALTAEAVVQLARIRDEESAVAAVAWVRDSADQTVLGQRLGWLVIVSFVVCLVGITNAMLMSVTQRFREIATMKCLGALDGFIALAFILEACMLGVVGGLIGAVVGLIIGLGRMFGAFGGLLVDAIPYDELAAAVGAAVMLGVLLAAMATVLPALKAARLAPMEAMRVE